MRLRGIVTPLVASLPAIAAGVPSPASAGSAGAVPSFLNDVVPVLTRLGCNQGSCHGKLAGQNGFRLSLRGYAPEVDHLSLTREMGSRRVNVAFPEQSLILTKATGALPHRGGVLLREGTREHETLLAWIRAGAPGPAKGEGAAVRLELRPAAITARPGEPIELRAFATFAGGEVRDVTWLARFEANDRGLVDLDVGGKGRVLREGETATRASFQALAAAATITVPRPAPAGHDAYRERANVIDDHVFPKLEALGIVPSGPATDAEFIRRAFLDAIGTLPTPREVEELLADRRPDMRARVVDRLLERPEFVDYWTLDLADLFQNRKERDHDVRAVKGVRQLHRWLRKQVAENRPWDQVARDVLLAKGPVSECPPVGYYLVTVGEEREADRSELVASAAQALLGTRILCAKCHNHPLERYTQDDFYRFAAFFSRVKLERKDPKDGVTSLLVSMPDPGRNKERVGVVQPRTGEFLAPRPLDRSELDVAPGDDPREKLARWVTDPSNEAFAGAMVNRIWKRLFAVGLVEPVDDLRETNPPSNPGLWKALIRELVSSGFDRKRLIRLIMTSRAYQLSSRTMPGNETDERFFSRYYVRRLPAEVLLDAIASATGAPDEFPGYPAGLRAVQLPDPGAGSSFLGLFGRSERVTACACERTGDVSLAQLLRMQNGADVLGKVRAAGARLDGLLGSGKPDADVARDLFLAALSRPPGDAERAAVAAAVAEGRDDAFRDLLWALLNSKEFAFNH